MNATTRRLPEIEFEKEMSQKARDLYMAALAAEKAGKFSEALRQYKAAAREDTEFREAFVNLGALYSRAKRPDLAIGFFRRALDLRADAIVFFNLGSECYKLERLDESEKYLKAALKLEKRLLKAHILLGYLYEKRKQYDKCAIYFQNALRIDPTARPAVLGLAVAYSDQSKFEEALAILEKYHEHAPGDAFVNDLRAGLYLKLGRYEESLGEYRELTQKDKGYVDFSNYLTKAREEHAGEYQAMFDGIDSGIRERTARLRKKIEQRKARLQSKDKSKPADAPEELKADLKDMVDLSFLHLFNGDTDKALRFLMQARKMKEQRQ